MISNILTKAFLRQIRRQIVALGLIVSEDHSTQESRLVLFSKNGYSGIITIYTTLHGNHEPGTIAVIIADSLGEIKQSFYHISRPDANEWAVKRAQAMA